MDHYPVIQLFNLGIDASSEYEVEKNPGDRVYKIFHRSENNRLCYIKCCRLISNLNLKLSFFKVFFIIGCDISKVFHWNLKTYCLRLTCFQIDFFKSP